MADKKISELEAILGSATADDDLLVIVDSSTNQTKKITKAELQSTINAALIDGAPAALDTLNEIAAALNDDANLYTTLTTQINAKVSKSGDTMTGDLNFGDNDKAVFGAGSDLQIYHDGSNSFISDTGTGSLYIGAESEVQLRSYSTNEKFLVGTSNGPTSIYHNGNRKLDTTATGVDVTGTVTADGLTVQGADAGRVLTGIFQNTTNAAGTSSGISLRNSADTTSVNLTAERVGSNAGADLVITGFDNAGVEKNFMRITEGNDISFYEDTGTTPKFFWDASAERLGIGTSSPSAPLHLSGGTANSVYAYFDNQNQRALRFSSFAVGGVDNAGHLINASSGAGNIAFATGSTERMRIDSTGVDVTGTVTADGLTVDGDATTDSIEYTANSSFPTTGVTLNANGFSYEMTGSQGKIFRSAGNSKALMQISGQNDISFYEDTGTTPKFFWDASAERLGIGTSSPGRTLHLENSSGNLLKLNNSATANNSYSLIEFTTSGGANNQIRSYQEDASNSYFSFYTKGSGNVAERMRIDSSGNVDIGGTTSTAVKLSVAGAVGPQNGSAASPTHTFYSDPNTGMFRPAVDTLGFSTGGSEKMRIQTSGDVGIGISSPAAKLHVANTSDDLQMRIGALSSGLDPYVRFMGRSTGGTNRYADIKLDAENDLFTLMAPKTTSPNIDALNIDSSGNLLVGKTTNGIATAGFEVENGGAVLNARAGTVARFNRLSSDGTIIELRKDASTVGSITAAANGVSLNILANNNNAGWGTANVALWADDNGNNFAPVTLNATGASLRDNAIDIGRSNGRFDDIYATNGTIQTSDRNEKQDIASLTSTEMNVAKRISAMFKKFRWIDSVTEKGDDARIHSGVIAQDVQQAFADEGLDAGDYALFISTTWDVDAEGNAVEEGSDAVVAGQKTRMGIRYPQLLSFLAAYNEQRFSAIEARLDALEA